MEYLSAESFGRMFYAVSPNKTTFEDVEDVPNYYVEAFPWMAAFIFAERLHLWKERKILTVNAMRFNDLIGSTSLGLMDQITKLVLEGWRFAVYAYIYTNWRIVTLPWDSLWTWFVAFIAADFLYYWTHRASHEVNILWAGHQLHHSSEDYNLSTALRQSILVTHFVWVLYLPAALIVPPAAMMVHYQLNFLYQFWIHTEVIKYLGPLEYILNTASHHRVHHGRNRYCIDKNYAGVLIIWDRMFGTFEAEKDDEIAYGLVHPVNTFEPVTNQFGYFLSLLKSSWSIEGWRNKLSVLFKGPGWSPGKPRLGSIEDIPEVEFPVQKYDPQLPIWCQMYSLLHGVIIIGLYVVLHHVQPVTPPEIVVGVVSYLVFTLASIGIILDGKPYAVVVESFRCLLYIAVDYYFSPWIVLPPTVPISEANLLLLNRGIYLISGFIWVTALLNSFKIAWHFKKFIKS
ncbi:Alkylglycerol monooxygenase [Araneus ventricosus]|uniref:Alkylglycerol monooxygenase n=1 Tax=Araneus ventricosus TaxID=182803 RepID=A0A4Y2BVW4_ARAVE|nr:Alkylglycerol monooxygenase [Araneus ventricosus]